MSVVVAPNAEAFARRGAELVLDAAREAIAARGRFVVALTGGSTPIPIHRALAAITDLDWTKVEVFFGDERAVAPDDARSNYGSARESLLRHVPANVHRMVGEHPDLDEAARAYERELRETCEGALDLLMVGVGKDAHILSLHPGAAAIGETSALVVAVIDPPMSPAASRITMTPMMIGRARRVLALASGAEKRDAVAAAIDGALDVSKIPAQLLRSNLETTWLLDEAAAAGLARR